MDAVSDARRSLPSALRPITQSADASRDEDGVRAYVAARASARLGLAVVDAVAKSVTVAAPPLAAPLVTSAIEAAALALPSGSPWGPTEERAAMRGAVRAAGKAYALAALEEPPVAASARWVLRLGALAAALEKASRAATGRTAAARP
jgi:hypothetical protein